MTSKFPCPDRPKYDARDDGKGNFSLPVWNGAALFRMAVYRLVFGRA